MSGIKGGWIDSQVPIAMYNLHFVTLVIIFTPKRLWHSNDGIKGLKVC